MIWKTINNRYPHTFILNMDYDDLEKNVREPLLLLPTHTQPKASSCNATVFVLVVLIIFIGIQTIFNYKVLAAIQSRQQLELENLCWRLKFQCEQTPWWESCLDRLNEECAAVIGVI